MRHKTQQVINDSFEHNLRYIHKQDDLKAVCEKCSEYCGDQHDYECCKGQCPVLDWWLAYDFLDTYYGWQESGGDRMGR